MYRKYINIVEAATAFAPRTASVLVSVVQVV